MAGAKARLRAAEARAAKTRAKRAAKPTCNATTKRGTRCKNTVIVADGKCMAHLPEEVRRERGFGGSQPRAGRPKVRANDLQRIITEAAVEEVLRPYFSALGLEYTIDYESEDGSPHVVVTKKSAGQVWDEEAGEYINIGGGLVLHGESKDGDIVMTRHPDLAGQVAIAEKLLDRVYGKPKQSHELAGAGGGPIKVDVPRTATRAAEVAQILAEAGGIPGIPGAPGVATPHEGRRRKLPPALAERMAKQNGHTNGNNGH